MALNYFDAIVYINLSHRQDRDTLIQEELRRLQVSPEKIYRLEGIHDYLNGNRGCAQSHMKALELAKQNKWKHLLILEDDVRFTKTSSEVEETIVSFFQSFNQKWDVFFLGTNVIEYEESDHQEFKKILCAQCAHAYAVNAPYFDTLLACFEEAYASMLGKDLLYGSLNNTIDQCWKKLQRRDRWYMGKLLGQQRRSYSDIDHVIRDRDHPEII
jgi:GR25 family glycosyltransferase involved in LPS biosynthesis